MAHRKPLIVAAIDFGTTNTGWAYSFKHNFESDPRFVFSKNMGDKHRISLKAPSCVLIHVHDDGKMVVHSFGYDAEEEYYDRTDGNRDHNNLYFFRNIKMMLFREMGVNENTVIEDVNGRPVHALEVFSLVIRYLRDDLITEANQRLVGSGITQDEVHWVLTSPGIWNDGAKQFMRKAGELAGIKGENLTIALEAEAASLYYQHDLVSKFTTGSKYLLLDAGGGIVETICHEITSSGTIRELHQPSGGAWGATQVDEAFEEFLVELFGREIIETFKRKCIEDYLDLLREFEIKKHSITPEKAGAIRYRIPTELAETYRDVTKKVLKGTISSTKHADQVEVIRNKLQVNVEVMKSLFSGPVKSIVNHVRELLRNPSVTGCSTIVLAGEFSESRILSDEIKRAFPEQKVLIVNQAVNAVLRGAVIFGHSQRAIEERVCKYTYGTGTTHEFTDECTHLQTRCEKDEKGVLRCYDIFDTHVQIGQTVKLGEEQPERIYLPIYDDQTSVSFPMYASSLPNPYRTTQKGCHKIGECTVPIAKYDGSKREVGVRLAFGGTEIEVIIEDKTTGKVTRKRVDFLG